jgi:hypothetical protein
MMASWIYAAIGVGALLLLFPVAVAVAVMVIRARREAAKEPPAAAQSTEGASGFGENFTLHQ